MIIMKRMTPRLHTSGGRGERRGGGGGGGRQGRGEGEREKGEKLTAFALLIIS